MKNQDLPLSQMSAFPISNHFEELLDKRNKWIVLSERIPWEDFEESFGKLYSDNGRPAKSIRLMVGLLLIKQLENLSDERVTENFPENAYWQAFCGYRSFSFETPCHSTELVKFRNRIGTGGAELILKVTARMHGKNAEEKRVQVDTTVQEKNVAYPTDSRLCLKIIGRLHKIAKAENLALRRSFTREIKSLRPALRHFRNSKNAKAAAKALKRLRTIAGKLLRDVGWKLSPEKREKFAEDFETWEKILKQKKTDKDKTYSLHEPDTQCIAKGKTHKKYEFGKKVSVVKNEKSKVVVAVVVHEGRPNDSKTLDPALEQANRVRKTRVKEASRDRGYRGAKTGRCDKVIIPGNPKKSDSEYQRRKKRKICRARASIEPVIGHLKSDFRMARCFLKGAAGDAFNAMMAGCAWNLKLLWRKLLLSFFCLFFRRKRPVYFVFSPLTTFR